MRVDGNHGGSSATNRTAMANGRSSRTSRNRRCERRGAADHWNHREDGDYYSQPGNLFRLMTAEQKQILFENTARSVGGASIEIQQRHIENCRKAHPAYGDGVAKALNRGVSSTTPNAVV